ncbi:UDP-glycosyltransferase 73C4-like [Tasmannia lanceolata]|uniref:UDP-glycosyltransferase 73C4-like n=1 Tax=Tasmannia lanceolata TaxID=3420 RepID=UPI004064B0A9
MDSQPHLIMIPFLAQGHMIPMIDMARLFAARGAIVTIITTSLNASRYEPIIGRAADSGLKIRLLPLQFPCKEAGLPEGCENLDTVPSLDLLRNFIDAIGMLQQPVEQFLQEVRPDPSCIISDTGFPWTSETGQKFGIPRIVFHGMCCFALLCSHNVRHYMPHESVDSDSTPFVVPGLPHKIEVTKGQLPQSVLGRSNRQEFHKRIREAELTAYGVVVNSFEGLEPEFIEYYQKAIGKKVWTIGPMSLNNKEIADKMERGNKAAINENQCVRWLDSKKPKSVIYACFGSISHITTSQLMEIGLGLEASNYEFIWVIRSGKYSSEVDKWLSEGFEERIKDRGLIIRGWAPQILILSHPAIAGFVTHCGWNSTLEGVCAGLPMITWPFFADQFFNEKLVVQVLKIGVSIGAEVGVGFLEEEKDGTLVKMEMVRKAVELLMDEGEEGEGRRKRAKELSEMARRAMEEGGSSYLNMTNLIQDIMQHSEQKNTSSEETSNTENCL